MNSSLLIDLSIATLAGLAIGVEREWSGHATGPRARFAGVRTFTLLGLVAGLAGWLWTTGLSGPAIVLLAGLSALVVVAYYSASRRDVDGTTEVAAFVVLVAGVLAGTGYARLASAVTGLCLLLLVEKRQLHQLVSRIDLVEIRAGARFAVMAAVILPLLPEGPYGPLGGVRPRQLWAFVLFFSGLSFLGYLARRLTGDRRGYAVAGTLGGIVSSTSVTLTFSRLSRTHANLARPLAAGVMGANLMLFPRVLLATLVLARPVAEVLWPIFATPAAIAFLLLLTAMRDTAHDTSAVKEQNPLQFRAALQLTALFQLVLFALLLARSWFGLQGVFGSAALLGLTDVDALTMSMAKSATANTLTPAIAARAITIGILVNTVVKLVFAVSLGRGAFRAYAVTGLTLVAVALAAGLWFGRAVG